MLRAVFSRKNNVWCGFRISGHAGYGEAVSENEGNDIVCAAVSSCTMLVCNCITDFFKAKAEAEVLENRITLTLSERHEAAERLIEAFYGHLEMISEDYNGKVKLTIDS